MDGYTLTLEGMSRFRRMETRANVDASVDTIDFRLLQCLYERGSASVEEIERFTGLTRDETANEISVLMSRGLVEGTSKRDEPF